MVLTPGTYAAMVLTPGTYAAMVLTPGTYARPVLIYRDTCPKCRFLSRLVVLASLHSIHRIPIRSVDAENIMRLHPEISGKLALFHHSNAATGWSVVPLAMKCVVRSWITRWWPRL
jgi:hypothetical protein